MQENDVVRKSLVKPMLKKRKLYDASKGWFDRVASDVDNESKHASKVDTSNIDVGSNLAVFQVTVFFDVGIVAYDTALDAATRYSRRVFVRYYQSREWLCFLIK